MNSTRWTLIDPEGFEHRIVQDGPELFGSENIAHGTPRESREQIRLHILGALITRRRELPPGYREVING